MTSVNADRLYIVLVSPRNPLNIGAVARAMSNFGFAHLRLVNPYSVAFREARSAVHAAHVLKAASEYATLTEAVSDCSLVVGTTSVGTRELQHPVRRLEYGARLVRKHLTSGPAAILFGSEKFGLSKDDLSHCHWLMRIPTREEHGSMNLGQAVAICLYELMRQSKVAAKEPLRPRRSTGEDMERFTALWLDALKRSGYVNPRTASSTENKVRRLVRRLDLSARDAEIWLGMLRQILWKMEKPGVRNPNDEG
jgi:tRNA/rRNA methyltransferase